MELWKTLSRQTILEHSKFLSVESHHVELPDGRIIEDWPWIVTPDFVVVLAVTEEQKFLCFRQTKYGLTSLSLAPVGGYIEPGESPLVAAQRELLEETGYTAASWTSLGSYRVDPNRGIAMAHLFLAQGAQWKVPPDSDDLEEQELQQLNRSELKNALFSGEFKVLDWTAVVSLALLLLD